MTPIERAALALSQHDDAQGDEAGVCPNRSIEDLRRYPVDYERYVAQVRTVLAAIREPSEDMVEAGASHELGLALVAAWQRMIDAALAEAE